MADSAVRAQLAALNAAIDEVPIVPGVVDEQFHELEEVKRGLDDARLGLWARLQGVHASDARAYAERFRVRRCLEMVNRLTTDLNLGLMPAHHPEFSELWIALTALGKEIEKGRNRQNRGEV